MLKIFEKLQFLFNSSSFTMELEPKLVIFLAPAPKLWFKYTHSANIFINIASIKETTRGIGTQSGRANEERRGIKELTLQCKVGFVYITTIIIY